MQKRTLASLALLAGTSLILAGCDSGSDGGSDRADDDTSPHPNILFVIMDDVGIDQMRSFGYGGTQAPAMPNMDAVAQAGLRFRNAWSMPECSPGRAAFFAGRYPLRTGIYQAIGPQDLANSQLSPHEVTTPRILRQAGYESAMFGKFHLAGPDYNEAGNATPHTLGWDYFYGWIDGLPGSRDTTAGGIASKDTYVCGFVPGPAAPGGASWGACHQPDGSCTELQAGGPGQDSVGLQCLDSGGILVPEARCGAAPARLNFTEVNGYYVSPLVIVRDGALEEVPLDDARARGYRTRIETDAAIDWIKARPANRPWMATLSFTAAHTPWQQPPGSLTRGASLDGLDCTATGPGRLIQDRMTEAMDTEFGRLLVETGLATRRDDGSLNYDPSASNTVIVIMGDNGSLGTAVKAPFIASQAKGTAYQTGVWDPLIVAGPQVVQPGREVGHMVNAVDLYQFFGELAGLNVHELAPRTVDSVSMLPYLTTPDQASLRETNFTMSGMNHQTNGGRNGPCLIPGPTGNTCTQIPTTKAVCQDNQGVWWGPDYDDADVVDNGGVGYPTCAAVNQALFLNGRAQINILPESSAAIRNADYKLVRNTTIVYVPETDDFTTKVTEEMFRIDEAVPTPLLDTHDRNLLPPATPELQEQYTWLLGKLDALLASQPECPGDGNQDGVVDGEDVRQWQRIAREWGGSSVYDMVIGGVRDGLTNQQDGEVIQANLGTTCRPSHGVY